MNSMNNNQPEYFSIVAEVGSMNFMNKKLIVSSSLAGAAVGSIRVDIISHCLRKQTKFPFKNYD